MRWCRYRHEVALHEGYTYILGGGTSAAVYGFRKVPALSLATFAWEEYSTQRDPIYGYPQPRKFHSAVTYNGQTFICGGIGLEGAVFDDIWRLDLGTLRWSKMRSSLPIGLFFHSAAVTPAGCMYVFGGVTTHRGSHRTNRMYKMWITVPKLKDLAWEAIYSKSFRMLDGASRKTMSSGWYLPPSFVDRVRLHQSDESGDQ